jgi:hypothetical protein
LEVPTPDGWAWALAIPEDPGGPRALHQRTARLLEASLLAALSTPPDDAERLDRTPRSLHLFCYPPIAGDLERALAAFGLKPAPDEGDGWAAVHLALAAGRAPATRWWVPFLHGVLGAVKASQLDRELREVTVERWGELPGLPGQRLCQALQPALGPLGPDLASLDRIEGALITRQTGAIRWLPPLVFQALCDLVGAIAASELGAAAEWSVAEAEPGEPVPPPMLRVRGTVHVPIGLHLVRWWVMPLAEREDVPPLSTWCRSQFA